MKTVFQSFICVIAVMYGSLLGNYVGELAFNDATFNCHRYTSENRGILTNEYLNSIVPELVQKETPHVQKELDNPTSTFTTDPLNAEEYITNYYRAIFSRFDEGKAQALVCTNQDQKCVAIVFFSQDTSFNNALWLERNIVLNGLNIPYFLISIFLQALRTMILSHFYPNAQQTIIALPKGAELIAKYMSTNLGYAPCDYTGTAINVTNNVVYSLENL